MKPRLFFSHSTQKGSAERDSLMQLAAALETDYEILLDRKTLKPGEYWRSTINTWLANCDAAIILVHSESVASAFCQYEWAVLSHRRSIQNNFLIIPIYLGSIPKDIAARPEQIEEIGGYFEFDTIEKVVEEVKRQLQQVVLERPGTLIAFIASSLKGAVLSEDALENEADGLDLDLGTWDFSNDKWLKFAVKLMGSGLSAPVVRALNRLKGFFGKVQADKFTEIVKLIGQCSWVDMGSALRIRACALPNPPGNGLFGLRASDARTPECYVVAGSDTPGGNHWPVSSVLDVFASEGDLHEQVRSALVYSLRLDVDTSDATFRQELDFALKVQPYFIVLGAKGMSADWLNGLCTKELFAGVNFLVLIGETTPRGLLPRHSILTPELPPDFEKQVWDNYARAERILGLSRARVQAARG
jgi:TIR domain